MSNGLTYTGPINPNPGPGEARIVIYTYIPSLALGIIGLITFAIILGINLYYVLARRGRPKIQPPSPSAIAISNGGGASTSTIEIGAKAKGIRTFHILIMVGSAMEAAGYGVRIGSHYKPFRVEEFVGQYFLIVVAPVLFSAAIYLSLTLLVRHFRGAEKLLLLRQKLILAFFITADVVCTIIQAAGAALIGVSRSRQVSGERSPMTPKQANDILLAGLVCQCFSFLNFLIILSIAIYRAYRPGFAPSSGLSPAQYSRLKSMLWVIMITADLILLRTLFRLAETAEGFFGNPATSEGLFGGLEYAPVILAMIIWAVFPPRRFLHAGDHDGSVHGVDGSMTYKKGPQNSTLCEGNRRTEPA